MRKSRFTESQIVKVLKEVEGGRQVMEVCREYGISDATYYNWKANAGKVSEDSPHAIRSHWPYPIWPTSAGRWIS